MPSPQPSILIVGSDSGLLESRRMLLERTGSPVWTALSYAGYEHIPSAEPIALLVLCHSLSGLERDRALALAAERWNPLQSLSLISGNIGATAAPGGRVVDAHDGPAHLLDAVAKLLTQTDQAQRKSPRI